MYHDKFHDGILVIQNTCFMIIIIMIWPKWRDMSFSILYICYTLDRMWPQHPWFQSGSPLALGFRTACFGGWSLLKDGWLFGKRMDFFLPFPMGNFWCPCQFFDVFFGVYIYIHVSLWNRPNQILCTNGHDIGLHKSLYKMEISAISI